MTVLSAIQNASLKMGVTRPTVVYTGTTREQQELAALANDCAAMIAFDSGHEWTKLKALGAFTGTGVAAGFDLPADYKRMLKTARLWPSAQPNTPLTHYADSDDWLATQVQDFSAVTGAWTIIGDQVQIRIGGATSYLGSGDTVQFYYLTTNYAKDNGGTPKAAFTADNDTFRLPERLLSLALIYRWKQDKGLDYSEALSDYGNALFQEIGTDSGPSIVRLGRRRLTGAEYAFPGTIVPV